MYLRPRHLPAKDDEPATIRQEGGDVIEFLAWGKTEYWSSEAMFAKFDPTLDEFLADQPSPQIEDTLKRVVFQPDLWAAYDHLSDLNNRRIGDLATRQRRNTLCRKLAQCMQETLNRRRTQESA